MNEEDMAGITECCIDGVVITAELLSTYLRSWARHGIYFRTGAMPSPCDGPMANAWIVRHDALTYRFPYSHPDRMKRGILNGEFLNPAALECGALPTHMVADPVVVLPVAYVYATERLTLQKFLDRLAPFLAGLPSGCRYALGVQNREYLAPAYFDCLREHAVGHAFCTKKTMPGLLDQAQVPYALTADAAVVVTEPGMDAEWQLGIMEIVRRCLDAGKELYVCLETAAAYRVIPSLAVLMERMREDLARLSPIRAIKAA